MRTTITRRGWEVELIKNYPIIPGNNPAGYTGPPLTIDWQPISFVRISDINKYEDIRQPHRRGYDRLKIPAQQRDSMLRMLGFSRKEVQLYTKRATIRRNQRKMTLSTLKHQRAFERWSRRSEQLSMFWLWVGKVEQGVNIWNSTVQSTTNRPRLLWVDMMIKVTILAQGRPQGGLRLWVIDIKQSAKTNPSIKKCGYSQSVMQTHTFAAYDGTLALSGFSRQNSRFLFLRREAN